MKNIILIGMKGCGKTTMGKLLSKKLGKRFIELDAEINSLHAAKTGERLSCRDIFRIHGEPYFRDVETQALQTVAGKRNVVLSCGGGTPLSKNNQAVLCAMGTIIFLDTDPGVLLSRILKNGIPAFFSDRSNPEKSLSTVLAKRNPIYKKLAQIRMTVKHESPTKIVTEIMERIRI